MTAYTWHVGCSAIAIILSVGIAIGVGLLLWLGWVWVLAIAGGVFVVSLVGYVRATRSKG